MRKVNNRKIISKFSLRTIKSNRARNFITIMGIVLTTVLFTALFTIIGTMMKTQQHYIMRMRGDQTQAHYKFLNYEQFQQLKSDKGIKDVAYRISISNAENKKLNKLATEIWWMQDKDAKSSYCFPTTGRMPVKEDEIATSEIVLKMLGIKPKIGVSVPVEYYIDGEKFQKTFRLCGYFLGDKVATAQCMLLSRTFADKETPVIHKTFIQLLKEGKDPYQGSIVCSFNFKSQFNLKEQFKQLKKRIPLKGGIKAGLNEAYAEYSLNPKTARELGGAILLIMLSGYLIIYNIFYINVYADIRNLGLLKVIGTTKKQLKATVKKQAFYLSIIGIPIGLLLGWELGCVLVPVTMQNMDYRIDKTAVISSHPIIFIGAALFAAITVYISSIRPCKIAERISPMEALSLNEATNRRKKTKKSHHVTPLSMAIENIRRNKMKLVIVVVSLSISLIMINGIYTIITGFNFDIFIRDEISDDFTVTDATIEQSGNPYKVYDGVSKEFINKLKSRPGITQTGVIYYDNESKQYMDDPYFKKRVMNFFNSKSVKKEIHEHGEDDLVKQFIKEKWIPSAVSGFDSMAISKIELIDGKFDQKKWNSGKYVICSAYRGENKWYHVGEKLTLRTNKGENKQYEVMGLINEITYSVGPKEFMDIGIDILLPEKEYKKIYPKRKALRVIANASPDKRKEIEKWLDQYTKVTDPGLIYKSKDGYRKELSAQNGIYTVVGGALAGIIGFIGLLNFTGAMIASILVRKNQFAILEAVGMTERQIKRMLAVEGSIYAVVTILVSLIFDRLIQNKIVNDLAGEIYYFEIHDTVAPILCIGPILLLIVIVIPLIAYRIICKKSVVDRLRIEN